MAAVFDVERARRETRGSAEGIHLDSAGAALPPAPVADLLYDFLRDEELLGGYEVMARRATELENFYRAAARLLGCSANEIAFADSASRAWAAAFYALKLGPGDRILVGSAEYGSNLVALLHRAQRDGVEIVPVPDDAAGQVDVAALREMVDDRTRLICLTHVPSGSGLINPAATVGRVARDAGVPYLLDACQSLGQLPVDVEAIGCDMLCGTGRKFLRGPRGTGLLYVRHSLLQTLEPAELNHHAAELLDHASYRLRDDARRFEFWERSCAGQAALGRAIDYALEWGLDAIGERVSALAAALRRQLTGLEGVTVMDRGRELCGIVTLRAKRLSAEALQRDLAVRGIRTTTVGFSANPLQLATAGSPLLLRASPHYYNTLDEVEQFVAVLHELLRS